MVAAAGALGVVGVVGAVGAVGAAGALGAVAPSTAFGGGIRAPGTSSPFTIVA
jgi:hypothetical protein